MYEIGDPIVGTLASDEGISDENIASSTDKILIDGELDEKTEEEIALEELSQIY
jgi:hypothetical protein